MVATRMPKNLKYRLRFSLLYLAVAVILTTLGIGLYQGGVSIAQLQAGDIHIGELPQALTLSLLRILIAYGFALAFSFVAGVIAARSRWGEKILVPTLDVLQSIPIVGFFPAAIAFFISLTNGQRIGVEMAAIFLIFTSQAWNMAFAVYESVKSMPSDTNDAVESFGIRGKDRIWKLYLPVCIPRLVYNSLLSWANGWFFLVACEIIAHGPIRYHIPGIGSFLARAAEQDQVHLVIWGLVALTILIVLFDFAVWRPLSSWADDFRNESVADENQDVPFASQVYHSIAKGLRPTRKMFRAMIYPFQWAFREVFSPLFIDLPLFLMQSVAGSLKNLVGKFIVSRKVQDQDPHYQNFLVEQKMSRVTDIVIWSVITIAGAYGAYFLLKLLSPPWPTIVREIPEAILISTGRLFFVMLISLAWIIPLVLFLWNRPRLRQSFSTIAQIGASLPAIALFPLFVLVVAERLGGGMELASILLLLTGMQWYLLFNCLGGASNIPNDLDEITRSLGLKNHQVWRRLVFPAMRPALVTGALTAWGGGWNALVVAEYLYFKDNVLKVNGIGALLNHAVYELGDHRAIMLCLAAMVGWILLLNVLFWQPFYQLATTKYRMDI